MNAERSAVGEPPLTMRIAEGFTEVLSPNFVLDLLEQHPGSIFGLLPGGHLAYVNPAWIRFAHDNHAPVYDPPRSWIGASYLDVIAEPLKPFYTRLFENAPNEGTAMHPVSHVYECSTPDTFRQFVMKVYALPNGEGFVIINSLIASRPHDVSQRPPQAPNRALYDTPDGLILQCAHCPFAALISRDGTGCRRGWSKPQPACHTVSATCALSTTIRMATTPGSAQVARALRM